MRHTIVFFLITLGLLSLSPVFPGTGSNKSAAETFLLEEDSPICLSFESYQKKDGWTPVVLSIKELNFLLWMDEAGRVSELREFGDHLVEPVCSIDVPAQCLVKDADTLYFEVYEQNSVRTRWRLSSGATAGTVPKKILSREGGIDLFLGNLRLKLNHVACDFQELSPGLFQVQFHGPMVLGHRELVYEKAKGIIYSTHGRNNRLPTGQSHTWSMNPNKPASGSIPPQERAALIALYNSTDGDNWTNNSGWKTPPLDVDGFALPGTENTWYGIGCDPGNTTVQSIYLPYNNLRGTLPPELGNMANLQELYLYNNQLSGSIPPELGNLANLQYLNLEGNQLSGSIPPELGNLANLQDLWLNWNQLSGSIPPELGNLAKLKSLLLAGDQFSGSIPPELGNLANLKSLYLDVNQLSGSIPPELGNLANLQYLNLEGNQLSGSIPPELGNLANLNWLNLSSNQLNGSIPSNLTNLTNLFDDSSDLRWNALYTNDDTLRAFLNSKQWGGNWESSQTIAPTNITASTVSPTSIGINWTPISYTAKTGGYRVFYSTTTGGPYTYFGITADKTASSFTATGLNPGTIYYFVVQTRTNPHGYNQNTVDSEYSAEVSAATLQDITIAGTVTSGGSGLSDVIITLDNSGGTATTDANGNYSVTVPYGWSGTAIPSKSGYNFSPPNRSYTNVTVNQTNQDFLGELTNQAPVADAGNPQSCIQGDIVSLNGSASYDPDGDPLTYSWLIVSKPAGSNAYLTNANSMTASLQTDAAGEYVVSLTVNDGLLDSTPGTVTVTAISFMEATTQKVTELKDTINNIPASSFDNKNDQENMIKKVKQILDLITINNDYCGARAQLQNSILNKIDGCAIDGNPHSHDSIITCPDQAAVYPLVQEALSLLDKIISNLGITC